MKCEVCNKGCEPIFCKSNPKASEYYCPACHKSYDMPEAMIHAAGLDVGVRTA